ncbi:MAG: transporter substrate-binding domain-containing protein, partial [Lysobacterales bacterium]
MKTYFKLLFFQTLAGLLSVMAHMPASAQDLDLTEAEQTWLTEHPTLRIAPDPDFPPLEFFDEQGRYQGLVADYMRLVAERLGVRLEAIRTNNWSQSIDALRSGEADLIGAMAPIDEFRKEFLFSATYFGFSDAIITNEDVKGQVRLEDLGGKQVLVVADWPAVQLLRNQYPDVFPVEVESTLEGLMKVAFKEYDYMIAFLPTATYIIREQALAGLHVAGLVGVTSGAAMVSKDSEILRGLIDKALASITEKERQSIENRWLPGLSAAAIIDATDLELSEAEQTWIEQHPVIRVHNEMDWPPFNFNVNGLPTGFSIDLMNLVVANTGLNVEYISGPSWDEFKEMLQAGDLDVLLNVDTSPPEPDYAIFTTNYATMATGVFVRDTNIKVNSLDDLKELRIAVVRGFSTQRYLEREHPQAELLLVDTLQEAVFAVMDGRADAIVDDFPAINYIIQQNTLSGLRVALMSTQPELRAAVAIGVRKDWPALRDILQKGIDALDEKEMAALRQKWLGAEIKPISTERKLELTTEERTWIADHPVIRVHNELDWPPFNFNENGKPSGFSIDYMNLVASRVGLQVEYISGPSWNQFLEMIRTREVDVISGATPTDARREYMHFTSTFIEQPMAVVIDDSTTGINSLEDLRGRRVAVVEGFFQHEYMERKYPEAELVLAKNVLDSLYAVMEGRADAMVSSFSSTKYLMDQHALIGLRVAVISRDPELVSSLALAVRKDWPVLRGILQKGMDSLDQEEVTELRQKWLGFTREPEAEDSLTKTIIWLVGITLGIFLLLIVLNRLSSHFSRDEGVGLQTGTLRFRILILGALSIFVALVGILGWLAMDHIKGKILHDVGNNLENVLITTAQRLDIWVNQQASVLNQVVKNPTLVRQTELLLNVAVGPEILLSSDALSGVRTVLEQHREALGLDFYIINPSGLSIGSSRDSSIGTKSPIARQKPELLERVFQGESVLVPPIISDLVMGDESQAGSSPLFIAVPIWGDRGEV